MSSEANSARIEPSVAVTHPREPHSYLAPCSLPASPPTTTAATPPKTNDGTSTGETLLRPILVLFIVGAIAVMVFAFMYERPNDSPTQKQEPTVLQKQDPKPIAQEQEQRPTAQEQEQRPPQTAPRKQEHLGPPQPPPKTLPPVAQPVTHIAITPVDPADSACIARIEHYLNAASNVIDVMRKQPDSSQYQECVRLLNHAHSRLRTPQAQNAKILAALNWCKRAHDLFAGPITKDNLQVLAGYTPPPPPANFTMLEDMRSPHNQHVVRMRQIWLREVAAQGLAQPNLLQPLKYQPDNSLWNKAVAQEHEIWLSVATLWGKSRRMHVAQLEDIVDRVRLNLSRMGEYVDNARGCLK